MKNAGTLKPREGEARRAFFIDSLTGPSRNSFFPDLAEREF